MRTNLGVRDTKREMRTHTEPRSIFVLLHLRVVCCVCVCVCVCVVCVCVCVCVCVVCVCVCVCVCVWMTRRVSLIRIMTDSSTTVMAVGHVLISVRPFSWMENILRQIDSTFWFLLPYSWPTSINTLKITVVSFWGASAAQDETVFVKHTAECWKRVWGVGRRVAVWEGGRGAGGGGWGGGGGGEIRWGGVPTRTLQVSRLGAVIASSDMTFRVNTMVRG